MTRCVAVVVVVCLLGLSQGLTTEEREARKKAIRMKTSRQLKEIFKELGISYASMSKEDMQKVAYKEDAVGRWEELHPEKKRKAPKGGDPNWNGGGFGGGSGFGGGDPKMEEMLRQMKGDFGGEKDPERRRILEKLAKKGMSFGGGSSMDTEQLKNMEKMLDGLGDSMGKGGEVPPIPGDDNNLRDASDIDAGDVAEEDKMEL